MFLNDFTRPVHTYCQSSGRPSSSASCLTTSYCYSFCILCNSSAFLPVTFSPFTVSSLSLSAVHVCCLTPLLHVQNPVLYPGYIQQPSVPAPSLPTLVHHHRGWTGLLPTRKPFVFSVVSVLFTSSHSFKRLCASLFPLLPFFFPLLVLS